METLIAAATATVLLWALLHWVGIASRSRYAFEPGYQEIHLVATPDGGKISLYRYPPQGVRRALPVILCHGLAANRFNFDLGEDVSLARTLGREGYDVWVLEVRGRGMSRRNGRNGGNSLFHYARPHPFDTYVREDGPAAIAYVRAKTGADRVHWIGHSMGGLILYGILQGDRAREIASGVALGSPGRIDPVHRLPYRSAAYRLLSLLPGLELAFVSRALAPVLGRLRFPPLYSPVNLENVDPVSVRRALCFLTSDVTRGELLQFLDWMRTGELRTFDHAYSYQRHFHRIRRPLFLIAGARDALVPPQAVEEVFGRVSSPKKRMCILGKENGQVEDYGHGDLLIGRHCQQEVFPLILGWLDEMEREEGERARKWMRLVAGSTSPQATAS
ncbi:MAG: alpha/beta fold hydrolase [bacterium]